MMFEQETNRNLMNIVEKLDLLKTENIYFLQKTHQENFENILKTSKLISFDNENRCMVNIEHIDNDYLLKSTKETSIRISDDYHLLDKIFSFGQIFENDMNIIHLTDFQSQYQCELFTILSKIIYPNCSHMKQHFLTLAPAVLDDDRATIKYDESSFENYIKDILANIVHERTADNPVIPMAVFKLQLMCRKQNSIVHLRSNLETNHDSLFLLYTGARLVSILNNYKEKSQNGFYSEREYFHEQLGNMLVNKDEQEFLKWINSFESKFLEISFENSNKIEINLDKIFQEFILFSRRLSPYYCKVRILTENQSHLYSTMFARLELIERIVNLLQRILSLIEIPLIERM